MKRGWVLVFCGLCSGYPCFAGALQPEPLPATETAPVWDGPQFVQADRAGNIFFFRGSTFEVYPLTKGGDLGKAVRFQTNASAGFVQQAVMSADGAQWLVYHDISVLRFVDGEEKPLPDLKWGPWGVAFLRDTPIVPVIPRPLGQSRHLPETMEVPWLVQLDRDRWSPLTKVTAMDVAGLLKSGGMNGAIAERAVVLEDDKEGKLWVAHRYAYHVERLTASGRRLLDITVDGGNIEKREETPGIEISLTADGGNPTDATRKAGTEKAKFFPFKNPPVLLAMAEGRDGRFYFLVRTKEGGTVLDRYAPERVALERMPLQFKADGTFSMAAGRDAIYIAAWDGRQGRWRISWDSLEQAEWKPVEGAEIDGIPVEEPATDSTKERGGHTRPSR